MARRVSISSIFHYLINCEAYYAHAEKSMKKIYKYLLNSHALHFIMKLLKYTTLYYYDERFVFTSK